MEKAAISKDPQQQKLRDMKKKWNAATSAFISRMIGFKQGINGRGSSTYQLPPSNIKNPLPQEIINFLSELTREFTNLAEEANRIAEEQKHYSETRRKPAEAKLATASIQHKVLIGKTVLPTLIAITSDEQERGLMYIEKPTIMSFVYDRPQVNRFWMSNTPQPLDIVFALDGRITNICKGDPFSTKLIGDWSPSDLVVELPYGSCSKLGVSIGDPLKLL